MLAFTRMTCGQRLKLMQDADAIVADCSDLIAQHKLNEEACSVVAKGMLADQLAAAVRRRADDHPLGAEGHRKANVRESGNRKNINK